METFQRSDEFEQPALDWLYEEAQNLRDVLVEAGILDEVLVRRVCRNYIFGLGVRLDGDEVQDPEPPRPALGFLMPDGGLMADDLFSFHEHAIGVVAEVFGDE